MATAPVDISGGGEAQHIAREFDHNVEEKAQEDMIQVPVSGAERGSRAPSLSEKITPQPPASSSSEDGAELKTADSKVLKPKGADDAEDPMAHLPEHERAILKRQLDIPPVKVTYFTLYRYATRNDKIIWAISALCAIAGGAAQPLMTVRYDCHSALSMLQLTYHRSSSAT